MRTRRLAASWVLAAACCGVLAAAGPAGASPTTGTDTDTSTTTLVPLEEQSPAQAPHIIPQPNSGAYPKRQGDRGSSQQFLVLGLIVVGIGGIGVFVARDAKKHPERRTPQPTPRDPDASA